MRSGRPKAELVLSVKERAKLERMRSDRDQPKLALRARIVLGCAEGLDNRTVAASLATSPVTVGKWRRRFRQYRIAGLQGGGPSASSMRLGKIVSKRIPVDPRLADPVPAVQPNRRTTLRDIARALDLHVSSISLGMKDDPRLPPGTRAKIRKMARQMNYRPDPMNRALAVYRQTLRPPSMQGTLALLTYDYSTFAKLTEWEKARQRATELGYQIEAIECHSAGPNRKRLTQILKARGVRGVLLLPPLLDAKVPRRLEIDWNLFPAVILGNAFFSPQLHRVEDDHLSNTRLLIRKLLSLGYRKIGLCLHEQRAFLHAGGGWEGGFYVEMRRQKVIVPPFYRKNPALDSQSAAAIQAWIQRNELEAVVFDNDFPARDFLAKCPEVAARIGVVSLACYSDHFSGIAPLYGHVWTTAVEFLVHLINTHQRGIPASPQRLLLRGEWVSGHTLSRINLQRDAGRRMDESVK